MSNLPKNLEDLPDRLPVSIEIDTNGVYCDRFEPRWSNYGTIMSEGSTLEELIDNASVDIMDQDGGELGVVEADEAWMIELIVSKWNELVQKNTVH